LPSKCKHPGGIWNAPALTALSSIAEEIVPFIILLYCCAEIDRYGYNPFLCWFRSSVPVIPPTIAYIFNMIGISVIVISTRCKMGIRSNATANH